MENEQTPQATGRDARTQAHTQAHTPEPLVLASTSPRRAEILRAVGWPFETSTSGVDESIKEGEGAVEYVRRLARAKAAGVASERLFGLVLDADTVVVLDGEVLGKPRDEADARRMLRSLGGRWHEVLTGVALVRAESGRAAVGHERTRVRFSELSEEEIESYVRSGEPADKAGAYAIQGRAALYIEGIEGDFWNVVGLPVRLLYKLARGMGGDAPPA